jgi:RNA polymerase subunit RPABC4/transcription elongation factor Spt4
MVLAGWPGGAWQDTVRLIVAVGIAYAAVLWLAVGVWAYRDIKSRTHDAASQGMAVMLVVLFNILGLVLYLILRPEQTLAESYERSLEAETLLHELEDHHLCPSCRRRVEEDFIICPYCRVGLREHCSKCGKALSVAWLACPYCGSERAAAAVRLGAKLPAFARPPRESGAEVSTEPASAPRSRSQLRPRAAGTPTPGPAGPANTEPLP